MSFDDLLNRLMNVEKTENKTGWNVFLNVSNSWILVSKRNFQGII